MNAAVSKWIPGVAYQRERFRSDLVAGLPTKPVAYVPAAALAAILISSALDLFNLTWPRDYYPLSKPEFRQSLFAMSSVTTVGVLPGVFSAVGLAQFKILHQALLPRDAGLGVVQSDGDTQALQS